MIEPLRIVDDADQRTLLGNEREQAEDAEADQETVRSVASAQPERAAERVALRRRQLLEAIQERRAELLQSCERELHLGLDARRSCDAASRRGSEEVLEQGGLADARLATQQE